MTAVVLPRSLYRVVGASGLTNLADGIRMVSMPLLAAALTDSATMVAAVFAVGQAPWLVMGLWAGKLADQVDRRRLIQYVAGARTLTLLVLALLVFAGLAPLWLVLVAAFVLGVGEVFTDNVSTALVPMLVPADHLEQANSRMVGAQIMGNELIGPAVGGLLFAAGASLPFFTNTSLLGCAVLLLAGLPLLDQPDDTEPHRRNAQAIEGLSFLLSNPRLRNVTGTTAILAAVDAAWFSLLVLFIQNSLGLGSIAFGLFLAIGAVGGLAGAAVANFRPRPKLDTLTWWVFGTMALSLIALGRWPTVLTCIGALFVTSAGFALWNVVIVSTRQRLTPTHLFGRVAAAYRLIVVAAGLLGAITGGLIADALSLNSALIIYGVVLVAVTPIAARRLS